MNPHSFKNICCSAAILFSIFLFAQTAFTQIPNLGSTSNFVLFTVAGAVGNTSTSNITGNLGTNAGAITGFDPPSNVNGAIYNGDGVTSQCSIDLQAAYTQLSNTVATNTVHAPAFGSGETLYPGIYAIGAAGSVAGTLILDAQSDPNAVFIFKFGGAFTTGAVSTIILSNGASACNVFWVADGAISMATLTSMKGTLIANGAVSMGAGCALEGRLLSIAGAVAVYAVTASLPLDCMNTTWTGAAGTTNWFTDGNWTRSTPNKNVKALIPNNLLSGRSYPIVDSGIAQVDTITIQSTATLTITNSTCQINGAILNNGILTSSNGSIIMDGPSSQTIQANTFLNNTILNLTVGEDLNIAGPAEITGTLSFKGSTHTLSTNGF